MHGTAWPLHFSPPLIPMSMVDMHTPPASPRTKSWWNQPCGPREVMVLALPLVLTTASWAIMHFVDRVFLTWYSAEAVAAAMPSGLITWTMLSLPVGIALYLNTFVAQYHGAGQPERIGAVTWQSLRIGLYSTPLFIAAIPLASWIFRQASNDESLVIHEIIFFQTHTLCAGATVMATALSAYFTGRGHTRVVLVVDVATAICNLSFDYLLIFGHLGFPELGIEGAALATVIATWGRLIAYVVAIWLDPERPSHQFLAGRKFEAALFWRFWRYGGPSGVQMLVESGAFSVFTLLITGLGTAALASSTMAFNLNVVVFVPMVGLGIAVSTLVGQQLGRNRPDLAARATWVSLGFTGIYTATFALIYIAIPRTLLSVYAAEADPIEFARLESTAIVLLRFVALYCLFDGMQFIITSALKGAGDTAFVVLSTLGTGTISMFTIWCGIHYFGGGLYWSWSVMATWLFSMCVVTGLRFMQGRWRSMRVIEYADNEAAEQIVNSSVR